MAVINSSTLVLSSGAAVLTYGLWKLVYTVVIVPLTSSLRHLPSPPSSSIIFGSLREIGNADAAVVHEKWTERYGPTFTYRALLNSDRLYTTDMKALNHILSSSEYEKPAMTRNSLASVCGKGLLTVEGESHRKQRRIMNPAFGPAQIRELTEIFLNKAMQLRDLWASEIAKSSGQVRLNVLEGLSKASLDVIGLAGFNYDIGALESGGKMSELHSAFTTLFSSTVPAFPLLAILQGQFPILRLIPTHNARLAQAALGVMRRVGLELVAEKKDAVLKELSRKSRSETGKVMHGRDLLTLLIKANMSPDLAENQRLSDEDMLAQVPTFLVAGHDTTSTAASWCLFALAGAPKVQHKLREELLLVDTEMPDMDELNALPYLDAFLKETLRLHAPVPSTLRVAARDDVVPLGTPVVDIYGKSHNSIKIDKGQTIFIPMLALNRSKELWGEDAFEFKPERWEKLPESITGVPSVWSHLMTFLSGAHACIGYRFSIVETKALIFTLVRAFEFELATPVGDIIKRSAIVQRPHVKSELEKGVQLPLLVKPYTRA